MRGMGFVVDDDKEEEKAVEKKAVEKKAVEKKAVEKKARSSKSKKDVEITEEKKKMLADAIKIHPARFQKLKTSEQCVIQAFVVEMGLVFK